MSRIQVAPVHSPNYVASIIDEIALEGLDGITSRDLWLRLNNRPNFPIRLGDDDSKSFIWNIVKKMVNVTFYKLPQERNPLVIFDRYENVDPYLGLVIEPVILPDNIYPHAKVDDPPAGIMGSCATYNSRVDVSVEVRNMSYKECLKKWGHKLVVVANQAARKRALYNPDVNPDIDLTSMQYCVLERIGRSRYHGEITQGKVSLQLIGEDSKSIFYLRKVLQKQRLIAKQLFHQKLGCHNSSGLLLHLPRFFVEMKPKALVITEQLINHIKAQPNAFIEYNKAKQFFNYGDSFKKFVKSPNFSKYVRLDNVLYRSVYPNATESEWKYKNSKERVLRILQLVDPNINGKDIWSKFEDIYDEDDEEKTGLLDEGCHVIDRTMFSQAFKVVDRAGPEGISQVELGAKLGLGKLQARAVCRKFARTKVTSTFVKDVGRQRITRFVSKRYDGKNTLKMEYMKEVERMQELVNAHSLKNEEHTKETEIKKKGVKNKSHKKHLPISNKSQSGPTLSPSSDSVMEDCTLVLNQKNVENKQGQLKRAKRKIDTKNDNYSLEDNNSHPSQKKVKVCPKKKENSLDNTSASETVDDLNRSTNDKNSVEIKIVTQVEKLDKVEKTGFIEEAVSNLHGSNLSSRLLKRANTIMETVQEKKVISPFKLLKTIQEQEKGEGYDEKIDKKSLLRIISRLQRSGHVKDINIQLIGYGKEKTLHFVCQPNISIDHSVIQSNIEQAKLKFITIGKGSIEKLSRRPVKGLTNELLYEGRTRKLPVHLKYNKKAGKSYGFCPKFLRMQILHKFLFYMTYGYTGHDDLNQEEALSKIKEQCDLTEDVSNMMSQIYVPTVDWMMFIPPLPNHGGYGKGWCLLSDVILRLPLLIFLQLVNINYEVPDLYDYLNHPIKKYLLVKNVPLHLKEILTFHRKFVHTIHELITRLCYAGLIQLGSQSFKEKEQVFVYVNTNAILFDTSTSRCGYHQVSKDIDYPVHKYKFKTSDNVEQFWYDCWNFCMHTLLGGRLCVTGKVIVIEPLANKPCMIEAVQSRTCNEVTELDVGYIPGDRLGAAGYDSAMFAHLKKNWYWTKPDCLKYPDSSNTVSSILKKTKEKSVEKRTTRAFDVLQVKPHTSSAMAVKQKYKQKKMIVKEMPHLLQKHSKSKKEAAIRILKARKSKSVRKPYYDPVDREALLRMKKLRVDWSPVEDNMLLLCKVTSCVLSPLNSKMLFNNSIIVREILHSAIPESKNKTSRACARRSNYIMKNPQTQLSVSLCLEELKHDRNIKDLYGDFMTKFNDDDSGEKLTPKQKEQIWNNKFKELFTIIEARYKRIDDNNFSTLRENFVIPDTISDFLKKFTVTKPAIKVNTSFNEVKSTVDIYYGVINAIIHSSLNTSADKTSWSYQLFNIYQHYPDKLLRAVMTQTRADQMISFRKSYLRTHQRSGNYLPLSASPYQLSISYVNLLSTRYQFTLYKDCSETLNEFKMKWLETDDEHEVLANKGGVTAFLVELVSMELLNFSLEIPDQVIILDPDFAQKDESYARIVKRYQDILVKLKHQDVTSTVLLDKTFISKCDNDSGESVNESTGKNRRLASSQQSVVAKAASHIALYLIREECDGNLQQKELQHAHDFFVVNSTKVFCSLASKEQSGEPAQAHHNELPPSFTRLDNSIVEKVLSDIKRRATFTVKFDKISKETEAGSTNNISTTLTHELIDFIRNKKEIGASIKDIREKYGIKSEIFELLSTLEEKQVLLRCGVITTRYVYKAFTKPWLVKSYNIKQFERKSVRVTTEVEVAIDKLDENEVQKEDSNENHTKNIKLKNDLNICIRPWIRINGTINRKTLDRLLSSVLGHVMLVPGCTLQDLQDRFCPALQPYHTRELAEILQTLGCVEMITVCVSHKPSLRSKPSVTSTKKVVGLEKESNVFLEPDPMAIIKLSAFISENSYFQDDPFSE